MATALKTAQPRPLPRQQARSRSHAQGRPVQPVPYPVPTRPTTPSLSVVSRSTPTRTMPSASVRQLPARRPMPTWLRLLIQLQRGSVIVTFVLMTAALVVYGSTIYMQQHWSKEYNKLKTLQRNERTMVAAGELMKNQLIQQAEQPGSGLVPRTATHTIVLEPQPPRVPVTANPVLKVDPAANSDPLGY